MKTKNDFIVALVTAPNLKVARKLAKAALQERLVACANLIPKIESHYWWKGNIEQSTEVLVLFKTKRSQIASLEKLVVDRHPYDTPEFVLLDVRGGNPKYLEWWSSAIEEKGR